MSIATPLPERLRKWTAALIFFALCFSVETLLARETHKVRVTDRAALAALLAGGGRLIADYGTFQIVEVPASATVVTAAARVYTPGGVEAADDLDTILLNTGPVDTTAPVAKTAALAAAPTTFSGKRLHLVHFAGPVKPEWLAALTATGVQIVTYLPNNAYLVYGDSAAIARVRVPAVGSLLAATQDWQGTFQDSYKIDPRAKTTDAAGQPREIGTAYFAVQMVADAASNPATLATVRSLSTGALLQSGPSLNYYNVIAPLPPERLATVAARPDVISIQPYVVPGKFDERQDQIIAGNLTGTSPSGPGYLAFLTAHGFTQNQFSLSAFAVDVTDSGFDNGTTAPNHFGFYRGGIRPGLSRVVYNRLEGSANGASSTIKGADGHGNLNAHIIAGFNDLGAAPHVDTAGFHFGLGVAPFVRVGSSVIFDPDSYTSPNFANLQARAYRDGARVSSNSWGANTGGLYTIDAQAYDALVRDAQPSASAVPFPGNQEMVIVFANGNAGRGGAQTVGSPGTAKNVISVGAAENVQPFGGADGSGVDDSGSNSADDIIDFSSRGPCSDGRIKPEIVAPGTHVSGGVWQTANPASTGTADAGYKGTGVSGGIAPSLFYPGNGTQQQFFTASSGTSHSTPCVAGGAALVRQYFINRNLGIPSPALTKAFLVNTARYLNGNLAGGSLPSNNQGMGEMNLGMAFDSAARFLRDQLPADKFTATGQTRIFNLSVVDSAGPVRVTLAWTDAPGSTSGAAYNNNLDLTVVAGGSTYRGNVFSGSSSTTGGSADAKNNVESVFLPAGLSGPVTVTVLAANLNSDGVPGNADFLDQDFALVAYNALPSGTVSVLPVSSAVTAESVNPPNGLIDPGENVTVSFTLQNAGSATVSNLKATLQSTGGVSSPSGTQTYGALAAGATASKSFSFTANGTAGSQLTATLNLFDGSTSIGTATFNYLLPGASIVPGTTTLTAENLFGNNTIDPGETVTVAFRLDNGGDQNATNVSATLRATGGVTAPSGSQTYGAIAANGSATRNFTFTAGGALGGTITATFDLLDGASNIGTATFTLPLARGPNAVPNGATITAESLSPNGAIQPGETVTVSFGIKNDGDQPFGALLATLQPTGGVSNPSGAQDYGALNAGITVVRSFSFTANGAPGSALPVIFHLTDGATDYGTIQFDFVLAQLTVAYFPLDTDPGWTRQGEWAYGIPTGQGGGSFGFADPTGGATGTKVFGINLNGNYSVAVAPASYLTTGAIDASAFANTRLRFRRWLNTDYSPYVNASVEVSRDGNNWNAVFFNSDPVEIADSSWKTFEYDISAVADGQSTVFIRWGHQVVDSAAFAYAGWNIDDIEITGLPSTARVTNVAAPSVASGAYGAGNPIPIRVTFSSPVTVTGIPQLLLSTGGTATYDAGTSTATSLNFIYTIAPGENSPDLDYASVNALTLNGGSILDGPDPATLRLPAPGTAGSLGANNDIVIDTVAPTVTVAPDGTATTNSIIVFTLNFSEAVFALDGASINVTNGTKGNLSGSGTTYTLPVTASAFGPVTCQLPANVAGDRAANGNASSNLATVTYEPPRPSVAVTPSTGSTNSSPLTFNLSFSAPVTGLATAGVTVTNGTKGTISGNGSSYTIPVTPLGQGAVTCRVNAGAAQDGIGTPNTASNVAAVTFDSVAPSLAAVSLAANNGLTSRAKTGNVLTLNLTASEAISAPAVTLAHRAAQVSGNGTNWSASLPVLASDPEGLVPLAITYTDLAGNSGASVSATTNASSVIIDHTAPVLTAVAIASDNANPAAARKGDTVTLSFTASEGLQAPLVTLAGQTVESTAGVGNTWTASTVVTANFTEGPAPFSIAFTDLTGNLGAPVSATTDGSTVTIDPATKPPTLTAPASNLLSKSPVAIGFNLPEAALPGSVRLTFTGAQGSKVLTLAGSQESAGDHFFTFASANPTAAPAIAAGPAIPDDSYSVALSYQDALGNTAAAASATAITIDATPPALNLAARSLLADEHGFTLAPNLTGIASDAHGVPTFQQNPPAGASLGLGTHTVSITAIDGAGNQANGQLQLSVAFQRPAAPPAKVTVGAHTGTAAPGAGADGGPPADTVLDTFNAPAISDFRDLAAVVKLRAGRVASSGVYTEDSVGVASLAAFTGKPAPGFAEGVNFATFGDPVLAQGGGVAFTAKVKSKEVKPTGDEGLWSDAFDGQLRLIAREGESVPGLDGTRLKSVISFALRDSGLLLLAKLSGDSVTPKNNVALMLFSAVDSAQVLLRLGDPLAGSTIKSCGIL